jgi:alpha-ribazole phosphatase
VELVLIRHPRPAAAEGLCYGSSDLDADSAALAQCAAAVRDQLGAMPPAAGTLWFSSPLLRCMRLADMLTPGCARDARIAEMDFGAWEGKPWTAIPRAEIDAWVADLLHYRPGGGESVAAVAQRVQSFLDGLRSAGGERAVIICHAGTIRLITALAGGQPLETAALNAAATPHSIAYGEVLLLPLRAKPV